MTNYLIFENRYIELAENQEVSIEVASDGTLFLSYEAEGCTDVVDLSYDAFVRNHRESNEYRPFARSVSFEIDLPHFPTDKRGLDIFDGWEFSPYELERQIYEEGLKNPGASAPVHFYDGEHQRSYFNFIKLRRTQGQTFQLYWESFNLPEKRFMELIGDQNSSVYESPDFVVSSEVTMKADFYFEESRCCPGGPDFYEDKKQLVSKYFDLDNFDITEGTVGKKYHPSIHASSGSRMIEFALKKS